MDNFARRSKQDRYELFYRTATLMRIHEAIIEKDFWVCWMLDALFLSPQWREKMIFKGGTSLSKAFHIINRFSEDIDLIIDWGQLGIAADVAGKERSATQQDKFCKEVNRQAAAYLADTFAPGFEKILTEKLGYAVTVTAANQEVTIAYPRVFSLDYLRPEIVLEIGPLAEWIPHGTFNLTPYAAESFPELFSKKAASVTVILPQRTFWEKATILHKLANKGKIPARHSRHYYDLAMMARSDAKPAALADIALLREVIAFKQHFYRDPKALYEKALPGTFRLLPESPLLNELSEDYNRTKVMIFGTPPSFDSIMQTLRQLEDEINAIKA